jgi:hypothetical protein
MNWGYAGEVTVCALIFFIPARYALSMMIGAVVTWDRVAREQDEG